MKGDYVTGCACGRHSRDLIFALASRLPLTDGTSRSWTLWLGYPLSRQETPFSGIQVTPACLELERHHLLFPDLLE